MNKVFEYPEIQQEFTREITEQVFTMEEPVTVFIREATQQVFIGELDGHTSI